MAAVREITAAGHEALLLASELLRRIRRTDPYAGMWEAADVQWWWRKPRRSDEVSRPFWVDDEGPVAGVLLTSWADDRWQCDPVVAPDAPGPGLDQVWARAWDLLNDVATGEVEIPVRDDDPALAQLAAGAGLEPGEQYSTAWQNAADRPTVVAPGDGFTIVDRSRRADVPHPMRGRNGDGVAERLSQCPLYDPALDLAVETADGQPAAYSLYWYDPVTKVGLVEPVRVEDDFQRRGLARAMLTEGLDRLARRGAVRLKIGFGSEPAGALYQSVGFRPTSTDRTYGGAVAR